MRVINPNKFFAKLNQTPPLEYSRKKEEIEQQTKLLELKCSLENRESTQEETAYIVNLMFERDEILADWVDPL